MVNYNDIAKLAKVSSTTVSHVINETRLVLPETKKRVVDAMRDLNYQPNLLARGLATGKTHTIGLVITDIRNPFYPELIQGVEELAVKNNYNIFLCNTNYDIEKGLKSIWALIRKKIDGIIVTSSQADDLLIGELISSKIPVVFVNWGKRNVNIDCICVDYKVGITEAVEYLVSLNHKKIYFISGPITLKTAKIRIDNFVEAIKKSGRVDLSHRTIEGNHKIDGGFEAAKEILKEKRLPTAVVCSNDLTAIGAMKAFGVAGIKIPEDISVIGLDNIMLTKIVSPALTTIGLERYKIGRMAMEFLLKRIKDKNLPRQTCIFKTKLIVRKSTAEAGK